MNKIADSTKNKIEALNQELTPTKEERNKLNLEAKKWAEKRNTLNEKVRNLRKDADTIKEKRDAINKQVQELKNLRDQVNTKGKEKRDKISELQEKIRVLNEKRPDGNLRQVAREIEEIDWKIQTNSLPVKEEDDLVNQIRQLETQLVVQKRIKKVKDKLFEMQTEQRGFGTEAKTIHEKLSELAEQSQKHHLQMVGILEKAHELQAEANEAHQKHVETRQQAQQQHEKCVELIEKIKAIEQELKETADKKQAERQGELQKELEERALTKLKRDEKLSWEEFQFLAEKGLL
ncbi:hypothetical protein GH146_04535 [archaeon]|nr:hypothetical protein [archaeon]